MPGKSAFDARRVDPAPGLALEIFVSSDMIRIGMGIVDRLKLQGIGYSNRVLKPVLIRTWRSPPKILSLSFFLS